MRAASRGEDGRALRVFSSRSRWSLAIAVGWLASALGCRGATVVVANAALEALGDENACAERVPAQLDALFAQESTSERGSYVFDWRRRYPPLGMTPHDVFIGSWYFSTTHTQGFTRTYSARLPFALSHSDDEHAALVVVGRSSEGFALADIHLLRTIHPSGVHVLGTRVGVVDDEELVLFDLEKESSRRERRVRLPPPRLNRAGGGVALARIGAGSYLVAAATPGNFGPGDRYTRFYRMDGDLDGELRSTYLGASMYEEPPAWRGDHRFSENLTLITECGTSALYLLHVTGADRLLGRGYYRLSRVDLFGDVPRVLPVALYTMRQRQSRCHLRSAGAAFVRPDHVLELVCHERARHEGLGLRRNDMFRFTRIVAPSE